MAINRIGIFTSGGDCVELNAVIRVVTKRTIPEYDWVAYGIMMLVTNSSVSTRLSLLAVMVVWLSEKAEAECRVMVLGHSQRGGRANTP